MSNWDYVIAQDSFQIYFPEGDYDINLLSEWYNVIPTNPEKISYYGANIELVKQHFQKFTDNMGEVRTKLTNDHHSNNILKVYCLVLLNAYGKVIGFAAQEFYKGFAANKKILYFIPEE